MKTESYLILFFLILLFSCENAIISQDEDINSQQNILRNNSLTIQINQQDKKLDGNNLYYSEIIKEHINQVKTPILSVPAGDFWNTITVFVTCDTTGDVSIYYTIDETEPTESSSKYSASTGIKIDKTATLKVVAYKDGLKCSETVTAKYTKQTAQTYTENKSGVMLQGFNWDSAPNYGNEYKIEKANPEWGKWYRTIQENAKEISNTFEYVWFPPPSKTDTASSQGYAPNELNNLNNCYGTEEELKTVIQAIKPAKAIADIVVNHRAGTTDWADFTNPRWTNDYTCICSDDTFFCEGNPGYGKTGGNKSSSTLYKPYRNLDHYNLIVQQGIYSWMNSVLKRVGFVGWRYDYVKGFDGEFIGYYNAMTKAEFSVGEYWPEYNYDQNPQTNEENWKTKINKWLEKTKEPINNVSAVSSRAFDFVLKRNLNKAFGWYKVENGQIIRNNSWNMSLLANKDSLIHSNSSAAVTFVDNHDTGSTQQHWELNWDNVPLAYTFILTHPGYPCVAWQHYFTGNSGKDWQYRGNETVSGTNKNFKEHIKYLIQLRQNLRIEYDSKIIVIESTETNYAANITGSKGEIIVKIGGELWSPTYDGYAGNYPIYSGTNFAIWQKDIAPTLVNLNITTNDSSKLFAWVWGGIHGDGEWININRDNDTNTFNMRIDNNASGFLVAKCLSNFKKPDWNAADCISYKSPDILLTKGTTKYSVDSFMEYSPNL